MSDLLLTAAEAATRMGFRSKKVVYRLTEKNQLAHIRERDEVCTRTRRGRVEQYRKPGRVWILESDCDAWLASHRQAAQTPAPIAPVRVPVDAARTTGLEMPSERRFS